MHKIKQFLLSRKVVLTLILLILAAIVAGYIFPQKFTSTKEQFEKWHEAHPYLTPWVGRLGLDHVYTTPWFAVLLLIFLFTLILSTVEQVRLSYKKTFDHGTAPDVQGVEVSADRKKIVDSTPRPRPMAIVVSQGPSPFTRNGPPNSPLPTKNADVSTASVAKMSVVARPGSKPKRDSPLSIPATLAIAIAH